jgi:predicted nucleotidyltransferase
VKQKHYATRLAEVCSHLNAEHARYVLVGAAALQLWGTTRATRDVDILIDPTVPNAKRVLRALALRYAEAEPAATLFEVEGVKIPTASIEHLIESKRTGRLQDAADIEVLEEIRRMRG